MEHDCLRCEEALTADDIAIFRKLVCRVAEEYLCMACLADDFGIPRKKLEDIADYYHRTGVCCLFPRYN